MCILTLFFSPSSITKIEADEEEEEAKIKSLYKKKIKKKIKTFRTVTFAAVKWYDESDNNS